MSKRTRVLAWCLSGLTAAGAGGWVAYSQTDLAKSADDLDNQRMLARQEGVPIDYKSIGVSPMRVGENAAPFVLAAIQEYEMVPQPPTLLPYDAVKATSGKLRSDLKAYDTTFKKVELAVSRKKLDFHRPYYKGPEVLFREVAPYKQIVRLLSLRATLKAEFGDEAGALNDLRLAARFTALLHDQPEMIGALVHAAAETTVIEAMKRIASRTRSLRTLDGCEKLIVQLGPLPKAKQMFSFEVASSVNATRYFIDHPNECTPMSPFFSFPAVAKASEARSIKHWRKIYSVLPDDPDKYREVALPFQQVTEESFASEDIADFYAAVTRPVFAQALDAIIEMNARRMVCQTGIGLLRLRLTTGRHPHLNPIKSTDPFTGQPLLCRQAGNVLLVWSVGRNRVDDRATYDLSKRLDDLAFAIP